MKKWMHKLIDQFDFEWQDKKGEGVEISESRATLLFVIDTMNKHLFEIDRHPVRKVRETLDEFAKQIVDPSKKDISKVLFRFRQWYSSYKIDEYAYVQKTFDDFRSIIWDFIDQLSEDFSNEQSDDKEVRDRLSNLKEAVEANSIDLLKDQSRLFIDFYIEHSTKREERRSRRMKSIKKNLELVKTKLTEANESMREDHLTKAFNRKSFDEQMAQHYRMFKLSRVPVSLITLDIDHFKKFNDTYGHDVGDVVLKELVRMLKELFTRDQDFVARIGGEEFAVILPGHQINNAVKEAEMVLAKVRNEVFIHGSEKLSFTVSMGVAQLLEGEDVSGWLKRADEALYEAKNNGRNRFTIAPNVIKPSVA